MMRARFYLFVFALLATAPLLPAGESGYTLPQPSQAVEIVRYEWHDDARNRDVPVKIYYPAKGSGPFPVIIFSHGLGGTREGYEYLGSYWAGCGYVSVHLQHLGSDDAVWKGVPLADIHTALVKAIKDPTNGLNRIQDVTFAIDQLEKLNTGTSSPLHSRLDLAHIGMSGHSFGAWTTVAAVGEDFGPDLGGTKWADKRIKAAIAMSCAVPKSQEDRDRAFTNIAVPVFHMTGTLDDSPVGDTKAADRRMPFDKMEHAETCLVIFKDADHMTFSGHIVPRPSDEKFHPLICAGSVAFWDAYLRGNAAAKSWLYDGGFQKLIGDQGTFEKKIPAATK